VLEVLFINRSLFASAIIKLESPLGLESEQGFLLGNIGPGSDNFRVRIWLRKRKKTKNGTEIYNLLLVVVQYLEDTGVYKMLKGFS
jgi:hypothetical protein